jgi:hypothetical protein
LDRGGPVKFGPNELTVMGSPLFEEQLRQGAKIEWGITKKIEMRYIAEGEDGRLLGQIDAVPCRIKGDMKHMEVTGELPECPFGMHMILRAASGHRRPISCKITFRPNLWRGQGLLQLAYFEQLYSVYRNIAGGARLRTYVVDKGNVTSLGFGAIKEVPMVAQIAGFLEIVGRAREVAEQLDINPHFPGVLTEEHINQICALHEVLTETPRPLPDVSLKAEIVPNLGVDALLAAFVNCPKGALKMTGPKDFKLFDANVELQVEHTITHCDLASNTDALRIAAASAGPGEAVPIEWKSNKDTILTIRRVSKG